MDPPAPVLPQAPCLAELSRPTAEEAGAGRGDLRRWDGGWEPTSGGGGVKMGADLGRRGEGPTSAWGMGARPRRGPRRSPARRAVGPGVASGPLRPALRPWAPGPASGLSECGARRPRPPSPPPGPPPSAFGRAAPPLPVRADPTVPPARGAGDTRGVGHGTRWGGDGTHTGDTRGGNGDTWRDGTRGEDTRGARDTLGGRGTHGGRGDTWCNGDGNVEDRQVHAGGAWWG